MNPKNSKASDPHRLLLNLTGKINLKRSDKYVALSSLRICYTWKNLVQPRERIFAKSYGFLSFAQNTSKSICKNISINLSGKYIPKLLDHAKQFDTDALKAFSKIAIQKIAEATDDLIGDKIANRIINLSRSSLQNNSETITNENDKEIPKKKDIYLQKKDIKLLKIPKKKKIYISRRKTSSY